MALKIGTSCGMREAAQEPADNGVIKDVSETVPVTVAGEAVHVRGWALEGVADVSTAFIGREGVK